MNSADQDIRARCRLPRAPVTATLEVEMKEQEDKGRFGLSKGHLPCPGSSLRNGKPLLSPSNGL